jgi:hypothetical protein
MRYTDLLFALTAQATILGDPPNSLKVLGSVLVMAQVGAILWKAHARAAAEQAAASSKAAEPVTDGWELLGVSEGAPVAVGGCGERGSVPQVR